MKNTFLIAAIVFVNSIYSQNHIELLDRASAKADSGLHHEALTIYNELIESYPSYIYAYYNRALSYQETGDTLRAIRDYKKYLSKKRFDSDAHANIAQLYFLTDDDEYKKHINKAVFYSKRDLTYRRYRGFLYYYIGNDKKAIKDFNKVIRKLGGRAYFVDEEDSGAYIRDNCLFAYYYKSLINYNNDNYIEALKNVNLALNYGQDDADLYYLRAVINLELEKNDDACFDFTQAAHYGIEEAYAKLAEYCF
jgi:Flp pilus assembly protein TadD